MPAVQPVLDLRVKLFRVELPSNNRANNRAKHSKSTPDVKPKHRHRRHVSSNKKVPGVKRRLRLRRPGVNNNNNKYSKLPAVDVVEDQDQVVVVAVEVVVVVVVVVVVEEVAVAVVEVVAGVVALEAAVAAVAEVEDLAELEVVQELELEVVQELELGEPEVELEELASIRNRNVLTGLKPDTVLTNCITLT